MGLRFSQDIVPQHPAVVRLREKTAWGSMLINLASALKEYSGMEADQVKKLREKKLEKVKALAPKTARAHARTLEKVQNGQFPKNKKGDPKEQQEQKRLRLVALRNERHGTNSPRQSGPLPVFLRRAEERK